MKKVYRKCITMLHEIPNKIDVWKVFIFELVNISKKENRDLIKKNKLNKLQCKEIQDYWKNNYGKRISLKWHRLYGSFSKNTAIDFFPEIFFSTKLEPQMVDYDYAKVLEDKTYFDRIVLGTEAVTPETIVFKAKGHLFDKDRNLISYEDAIQLFKDDMSVVYKPTTGSSSGRGVLVDIVYKEILKKNNISINSLLQTNGDYIFQKKIFPCEEFKKIYPFAINTLRVMTYIVEDEIKVAPITMRIGQGGNTVDNIHAGGMFIGVCQNGKLMRNAYMQNGKSFQKHPDTNTVFEDYQLPCIERVVCVAKQLHRNLSHVDIASWDITIDEKYNIVVLEVNLKGQAIWLQQMEFGSGFWGEDTKYMMKKLRKRI